MTKGSELNDIYIPSMKQLKGQLWSSNQYLLVKVQYSWRNNDNIFHDDIVIFNFEPNGSKVIFQGIVMV